MVSVESKTSRGSGLAGGKAEWKGVLGQELWSKKECRGGREDRKKRREGFV